MSRYLIGLGNYSMTDDSIGLRLIEHIADNNLDTDFEVVEIGQDAMKLLFYFNENTKRIVVVDCVRMGCQPGEIRIFRPEEVATSCKQIGGFSTHEGDLLGTLEVAKKLGYHIPPLLIVGIEPVKIEVGMNLSPELTWRFNEYLETSLREVRA